MILNGEPLLTAKAKLLHRPDAVLVVLKIYQSYALVTVAKTLPPEDHN